MSVITINTDDFLTTKKDGEYVTAEEWNKLVALFTAINHNAEALIETNKAVDVNKANIAQATVGAVPDASITSEKLSTTHTLKNVYRRTEDTSVITGKNYYTYDGSVYTLAENLTKFISGVAYYELHIEEAGPAVNSSDVIGDRVITGAKIADRTLLASNCVTNIIGSLLKGCPINTYTKAITVKSTNTTVEFTLDKAHDAVIICTGNELILLRTGDNKVFGIGGTHTTGWGNIGDIYALSIKYDTPSNLQYIYTALDEGSGAASFTNLGGHIQTRVLDIQLKDKIITYTLKSLANVGDLSYDFSITVLGL